MSLIKNFFKEEEGMGTVEIVIILAVLVSIALIFRNTIMDFVTNAIESIFGDGEIIDESVDTSSKFKK